MIQTYQYLFYVFYTLFEKVFPLKPANKFRAVMAIIILELWFQFALVLIYWDVFLEDRTSIGFLSPEIFWPFLLIIVVNLKAFVFNDNLKMYKQRFDAWPIGKNDQGVRTVLCISILIVVFFFISAYVFSCKFPPNQHF